MEQQKEMLSFDILEFRYNFVIKYNFQIKGQLLFERSDDKVGRFWVLMNGGRYWLMQNNIVTKEIFTVCDLEDSYFELTGEKIERSLGL
jgi:hypothetical protein